MYYLTNNIDKEATMKNISLMKLTGVVMLTALASTAMNASATADEVSKNELKLAATDAKETISAQKVIAHDELFKPLDTDKNGLISQEELGGTDSTLLKKEFAKIDTNADQGISKQELKAYLEKVEVKVNI